LLSFWEPPRDTLRRPNKRPPAFFCELTVDLPPLTSLLTYSLDNYEWAKGIVAKNQTLGPRVAPLLQFGEDTTKKVLGASPVKLEAVIEAVDTRVDKAVVYTTETVQAVREAPGKLKNKTLTTVHSKLNDIKVDKDEEPAELGVSTIAEDVKVITSERLSMLLDASEGYLAQYLPISEEDKEEIKVEAPKGELKPIAVRSYRQSKIAAKRLQEQIINKITGLQATTKERVHVDLIKYSEFLDKQKEAVSGTIVLALEKVDAKAVQPTKEVVNKATNAVKTKVLVPAKERFDSVAIPFQNRVVRIWTVIGDEYDQKVVRPRAQIVQMFREELALQQELAKQKSGSGDDLTITAGLKAVVAAASARLQKEWEVRVKPTVKKVLGRKTEDEEVDDEDSE